MSGLSPTLFLAAQVPSLGLAGMVIVLILVAMGAQIAVFASKYRRVGPNQVMIVSGRIHHHRLPDFVVAVREDAQAAATFEKAGQSSVAAEQV